MRATAPKRPCEVTTWRAPSPDWPALTPGQKGRAFLRALVLVVMTYGLFLVYWIAAKLLRSSRATSAIASLWARIGVWLAGVRVEIIGTPMTQPGARVGNHASWLDIFVLRAAAPMFFVAKSEVRGWPLLGWIAAQTRTAFIERRRGAAKEQEAMFLGRLTAGDILCFFPEGTSSDGLRVLPFKSTLFSVFVSDGMRDKTWVQPMTITYTPAPHLPRNFYGWWGDMGFLEHFLQVMGRSRGGQATVHFHAPIHARDMPDRKALAAHCEAEVRSAMDREVAQMGLEVPEHPQQAAR